MKTMTWRLSHLLRRCCRVGLILALLPGSGCTKAESTSDDSKPRERADPQPPPKEETHMQDICHLVKIRVAPGQVYEAITTQDGVRGWWTRDTVLDSKLGGTAEFGFFNHRSVTKVRVDELTEPSHVGWKVLAGPPGWEGTTISFDLRADGNDTVLSFAQRGFKQADEPYAITTTTWGRYLGSLTQYLETGRGTPHPDNDFVRQAPTGRGAPPSR
jgi:uncharacterized protein YndB with AHSA1/START domain